MRPPRPLIARHLRRYCRRVDSRSRSAASRRCSTSGLDPQASNELMEHLAQMKSEGLAVLMATHDIFRAHQIASSIAILKEGRLAAALQPEDIKAGDLERLYLEHMSA